MQNILHMTSDAKTVQEYIDSLEGDRKEAISQLRKSIKKTLPKGFEEGMGNGMAGYSVPHKIYPAGYHCDPKQPLPFAGFASQKNHIAFYHMGIYGDPKLMEWFTTEYPKHTKARLDIGKSCVRFKKAADIPYDLIAELMGKMSVQDWINQYEELYLKNRKK